MTVKDVLNVRLCDEGAPKAEKSYVKVSVSPTGVVSFSTTKDEKHSSNRKELAKVFK